MNIAAAAAWRKLRERIADLERQLAAECIAKTVARRQLAERDQQLAESRAMLAQVTRADVPLTERTKG